MAAGTARPPPPLGTGSPPSGSIVSNACTGVRNSLG